jgi:hypothetical protein
MKNKAQKEQLAYKKKERERIKQFRKDKKNYAQKEQVEADEQKEREQKRLWAKKNRQQKKNNAQKEQFEADKKKNTERMRKVREDKKTNNAQKEQYKADKKKNTERMRQVREQKEAEQKEADKKKERERLRQFRERVLYGDIARDTGLDIPCACCLECKSKSAVKQLENVNFTEGQIEKHCMKINFTKAPDGNFFICKDCIGRIKKGKAPIKSIRNLFQITDFPQNLIDEIAKDKEVSNHEDKSVQLNKLESHLLKLVVPFMRIGYCPRGTSLNVKGGVINVQSDVAQTMARVLPTEQQFLPVAFKRKLAFKGHYLAQTVDVEKIAKYFNFFKENNHLFENVELDLKLMHRYIQQAAKEAEDFENQTESNVLPENDEEHLNEEEDDNEVLLDDLSREVNTNIYDNDDDDEEDIVQLHQTHDTMFVPQYEQDHKMPPGLVDKCVDLFSCTDLLRKTDNINQNLEWNEEEQDNIIDEIENVDNDETNNESETQERMSPEEEQDNIIDEIENGDNDEKNKESETQEYMSPEEVRAILQQVRLQWRLFKNHHLCFLLGGKRGCRSGGRDGQHLEIS